MFGNLMVTAGAPGRRVESAAALVAPRASCHNGRTARSWCTPMGAKGFDGGKGLWNACRGCSSPSLNRWTHNVTADSQLALAA